MSDIAIVFYMLNSRLCSKTISLSRIDEWQGASETMKECARQIRTVVSDYQILFDDRTQLNHILMERFQKNTLIRSVLNAGKKEILAF